MSRIEKYLAACDKGEREFSETELNRLYDEEEAYLNAFAEQKRQKKYRNGGYVRPKMVW